MSTGNDASGILAEYTRALDLATVPDQVVRHARLVIADTIGVLFAASPRSAVGTALRTISRGAGPCTIVGHGGGATAVDAAFVNGIGGHDIELDDSHSPSRTHPAAVVIPAALAAAERRGGTTIADTVAGVIAGYDVQARISKAMGRNAQYDRGFHPSAVCGVFGAAIAAARILRLDVGQLRSCIGLAASQSSGLLAYADDPFHMAKSFQTGIAARNGVTAAEFAAAGYRAAPDVLTGPRNVLTPFGGADVDISALTKELGEHYEVCWTSLKRHACCGLTHSAIDAMLLLVARPDVRVEAIERIDIELPTKAVPRIDGNILWSHNVQYVVSLAAIEGRVTLDYFTEEWTSDPGISKLAAKCRVTASSELDAEFPEKKGAIVSIKTSDGVYTQRVPAPRGSPGEPLTEREVFEKFAYLSRSVLDADSSTALWHLLVDGALEEPWSSVSTYLARQPRP